MKHREGLKIAKLLKRNNLARTLAGAIPGLLTALTSVLAPQFLFLVEAGGQTTTYPVSATYPSSPTYSNYATHPNYPYLTYPTYPYPTFLYPTYPIYSTGTGATTAPAQGIAAAPPSGPVVKTVPWVASNPLIPHDTWSGKVITLKGTSDIQTGGGTTINYTWDFGDGSPVATGSVTNRYAIQATHAYTGPAGTIFTATLTVQNVNTGQSASKQYFVKIEPKTLQVEVNVAIDEGLWALHKLQARTSSGGFDYGHWNVGSSMGYSWTGFFCTTPANILAFEVNGHLENGPSDNPYTETVSRGIRQMLGAHLLAVGINNQAGGNPDTNGNGIGIKVNQTDQYYQGGIYIDALIGTGAPTRVANVGGANIVGRTYKDIVQDMVDYYAWGMYDDPSYGGWRYGDHQFPDNSACQWAAIGIIPAERLWGCTFPAWAKVANVNWLNHSHYPPTGSFGYTGPNSFARGPYATTPSGMVQLAMHGIGRGNPLWDRAETLLRNNFGNTGNYNTNIKAYYYGLFAFVKAMLLHDSNADGTSEPISMLQSSNPTFPPIDWYAAQVAPDGTDSTNGVARTLVNDQNADGFWYENASVDATAERSLNTPWAIVMLQRSIFEQGTPVAVATANPNPAVAGQIIQLDGSNSFHQDATKSIDSWEWDLDNNGSFETSGPFPTVSYPVVGNYPVKLRVTDNGTPELSAETSLTIIVNVPPLPPTADAGGPYVFCPGVANWFLDGTGSTNPDEGQSQPGNPPNTIIEYAWELDGDNDFNDAFGPMPNVTAYFTSRGPGSYLMQLRVTDNTAASFPSSGQPNLSDTDSATVVVEANCDCISNLAARPKSGKIQLTWTYLAATHHYNVYRGTIAGGPYLKIASTNSTYATYLDETVVNGTTYFYVVRPADLLDREECQSNEASATPSARLR